jgi:hypothetical protein
MMRTTDSAYARVPNVYTCMSKRSAAASRNVFKCGRSFVMYWNGEMTYMPGGDVQDTARHARNSTAATLAQ